MVYTSYFGGLYRFATDPKDIVCVARYMPRGMHCDHDRSLAPTHEILSNYKAGRLTDADYVLKYKADVLDKLDPAKVYEKYNNKVLCCYEKPTDFCHRHLIRLWLISAGYECEELGCKYTDVWPTCLDKV